MKDVLIIVMIAFLVLFGLSLGTKKCNVNTSATSEVSQVVIPNTVQTVAPNLYKVFYKYFPDEVDTILIAAQRNNCISKENLCLLFAIRKAEAGKEGFEFGIKNPKANNLDTQAGWASATILKNRERWNKVNRPKPFIEFLGDRYCPTNGDLSNKEKELNKHWISNVKYWSEKLKKEC